MFPFETEYEMLVEDEEEREYEIDFRTGQLTGKIVTGIEAIKVWVWLTLSTVRYKYQQYSWEYGNEVESLIGTINSKEYIHATINRMLTECLTIHEKITGIENLECNIEGNKVIASFVIKTEYGEMDYTYHDEF